MLTKKVASVCHTDMAQPTTSIYIETPAPVSSIDARNDALLLGCEDGTVRRYQLPESRVRKALMGLSGAVSWLRFSPLKGQHDHIWLACGMDLFHFDFSTSESIISVASSAIIRPAQALAKVMVPPESEEDEINEFDIVKESLAFTTDSGRIGLLNLSTLEIMFMRQTHRNVALPISFIPGRPAELCSGGYDNTLLHFDARTGSLLSHIDLAPKMDEDSETTSISLSPPFALSIAVSPNDMIACSTASGHIWMGYGGSKRSEPNGKRKSRKWNGLKTDEGLWFRAGNGPIVAVKFHSRNESLLLALSLHGTLSCFETPRNYNDARPSEAKWSHESKKMVKATTMVTAERGVLRCGVTADRKGILELVDVPLLDHPGSS